MISRATARILAELYQAIFSGVYHRNGNTGRENSLDSLYDFLYDHEYSAWFCNIPKEILTTYDRRAIKDFIMKLHTGETSEDATPNWTWQQREKLGQTYLYDLSRDILNDFSKVTTQRPPQELYSNLISSLELDGYEYKDSRLLYSESTVLDEQEEAGVLEALYKELKLDNPEVTLHHLKLSSENYIASHWGDAISNARNFLEHVLREVYSAHNLTKNGNPCNPNIYTRPAEVRKYLERENLIEIKEANAIAEIYGLLSDTGSHPYIAEKDEARLMRHLALTFSQFVMLRYQGYLKTTGK